MENRYQEIFDILQDGLPADWEKVAFYAVYFEGSFSMKYYIWKGTEIINCYAFISDEEADREFYAINKILEKERESLEGNKRWNAFTMIVDSTGKMNCDYDYSNLSEGLIPFAESWNNKYLKQ